MRTEERWKNTTGSLKQELAGIKARLNRLDSLVLSMQGDTERTLRNISEEIRHSVAVIDNDLFPTAADGTPAEPCGVEQAFVPLERGAPTR